MRQVVYLFKTDGEPFHFKLQDKFTGERILVYGINPTMSKYTGEFEMHGKRIHQLFVDKEFQTKSWFWNYYMPALHAGGTTFYDIIPE